MKRFREFSEDLRKWFDKKDPQGGWKRIGTDGSVLGPCCDQTKMVMVIQMDQNPKCMSNRKIRQLTKKQRAVRAKRKYDKDPDRKGKPINVSNFGKGKL